MCVTVVPLQVVTPLLVVGLLLLLQHVVVAELGAGGPPSVVPSFVEPLNANILIKVARPSPPPVTARGCRVW